MPKPFPPFLVTLLLTLLRQSDRRHSISNFDLQSLVRAAGTCPEFLKSAGCNDSLQDWINGLIAADPEVWKQFMEALALLDIDQEQRDQLITAFTTLAPPNGNYVAQPPTNPNKDGGGAPANRWWLW